MNVTDPSGRLMRWKRRTNEFDFEFLCKKGKADTQADALSRLRTLGDTVLDFDEDIPCYLAEETSALERGEAVDAFALEEPFDSVDNVLATQSRSNPNFESITPEELAREQYKDDFCKNIPSRLKSGHQIPFTMDAP